MERYRKAALFALYAYVLISAIVLITEIPLIAPEWRWFYAFAKGLVISAAIPLAFWLKRDIRSQAANTWVGVMVMSYCILGQAFRPLHYFSVFQLTISYAVLFPVSKGRFRAVVGIGLALYLLVLRWRWEEVILASGPPLFSDLFIAVVVIGVIGYAANTFFSADRAFRDEAMQRFSQIGLQTARVVHDLKGLLSAPKIYVEILREKIATSGSADTESVEALNLLARDLGSFQKTLQELNRMSSLSSGASEPAPVAEILQSLKLLLKNQLSGVQLIHDETAICIRADRTALASMLMNLILNSIDAFRTRKVSGSRIVIEARGCRLTVCDNGGGFDPRVLDGISAGKFFSTRPGGSGLGLLLVHEEMRKLGGKVALTNETQGACVELTFPKKLIVSGTDRAD